MYPFIGIYNVRLAVVLLSTQIIFYFLLTTFLLHVLFSAQLRVHVNAYQLSTNLMSLTESAQEDHLFVNFVLSLGMRQMLPDLC